MIQASDEIADRIALWNRGIGRGALLNAAEAQRKMARAFGEWTILCPELYWPAYRTAGRVITPWETRPVFQDDDGRPCVKVYKHESVHFLTSKNFLVLDWLPVDPPAAPPAAPPAPAPEPEDEITALRARIEALEKEQKHQCEDCGKTFSSRAALDGHRRIHS